MAIYLDYNATAPVRPEVTGLMQELLARPANPSSAHRFGREAKKHVEAARGALAERLSAWPDEIIFTASATEANAMALRGFPGRRVVGSAIEHSSVLKMASGEWRVAGEKDYSPPSICPVDGSGVLDLSALERLLSAGGPALVSVMLANNETGVIQPVAEAAALCRKHGAILHCDAVQGLGKIPVDVGALGADMMTLAGHKCGGPVGAAALVARRNLPVAPLLTGGGQEMNRRAGTENVAAIAGFAKAVELIDLDHMRRLRGWLDAMEDGKEVFGKSAPRLPNTSCIAMPGVGNEVQLMDFDLKGFAVSAGSACSSGRIEPSHVLAAMGAPPELASCAIRVSGGWATRASDIDAFTEAWKSTCERLAKTRNPHEDH